MSISESLLLYPILITAITSLAISLYVWRQREVPGALAFSLAMLDVAFWSCATGFLELSSTVQDALVWYKLRYISIATVPVLFYIFVLRLFQRDRWLSKAVVAGLFVLPAITQAIIWLKFDLFVTSVTFSHTGKLFLIADDSIHGWFWFHLIYTQGMMVATLTVLALEVLRSRNIFHRQALYMLIAGVPPIVISAILATFVYKWFAHLVPVGFILFGLVIIWTIYRHRLLDLLPIAHHMLFENMAEGLIVEDYKHRIIELNPAARSLLGLVEKPQIGRPTHDTLSGFPELLEMFFSVEAGQAKLEIDQAGETRYFDVIFTPLLDKNTRLAGKMAVMRDVSALVKALQNSEQQLVKIKALQAELEELAIRDPLTRLYNRRYLSEFLEHEMAQAVRGQYPVAFVMIDLDHFKQINDHYGHYAGDLVLQALAEILLREKRRGDFACRYGGEEFLLVLVGSSKLDAAARVEGWRQIFAQTRNPESGSEVFATFSAGVAAFPEDGNRCEAIISAADKALYTAKANGRNRVEVARTL